MANKHPSSHQKYASWVRQQPENVPGKYIEGFDIKGWLSDDIANRPDPDDINDLPIREERRYG